MTPASKILEACAVLESPETWKSLCLISMAHAPDGTLSHEAINALDGFIEDLKLSLSLVGTVAGGNVYFSGAKDGDVTFSLSEKGRKYGEELAKGVRDA